MNLLTREGLLFRIMRNLLLAEFHVLGRTDFLFFFRMSHFHLANCKHQDRTAWALLAQIAKLREGILGGIGPMKGLFML